MLMTLFLLAWSFTSSLAYHVDFVEDLTGVVKVQRQVLSLSSISIITIQTSSITTSSNIYTLPPTSTTPTAITTSTTTGVNCITALSVAVTFEVLDTTLSAASIHLSGSIAALGDWNTSQSVALSKASTYSTTSPLWDVTLNLSRGLNVVYHYFLIHADGSNFTEVGNHTYQIPLGVCSELVSTGWWSVISTSTSSSLSTTSSTLSSSSVLTSTSSTLSSTSPSISSILSSQSSSTSLSSSTSSATSSSTVASTSTSFSTSTTTSSKSSTSTLGSSTSSSTSSFIPSTSSSTSASSSTLLSSTFTTSSSATSTPTVPYFYLNCYTEGNNTRALGSASLVNYTSMTVEICASFCLPTYTIFGLEYGGECWCGDAFGAGAVVAPAADCNMPCGGNATETCGSGNRLSVYSTSTAVVVPVHAPSVNNYTWSGCFTEGNGTRAFTSGTDIDYVGMTVQICAGFCYPNLMFGVEYGGECYCGNLDELNASGAQRAATTDCNMLCPGNASEYCGSANRLDVYQLPLNTGMGG